MKRYWEIDELIEHWTLLPNEITMLANKSGANRLGIDDALIQPYSGHSSRQSLEVYSRLSIGEAQEIYDKVMLKFPV
ncbi:hypothetical protein [Scytonema sp. PCC 10023]|uniref:hypothetical protein n=1 Tax=Scytonema sp. PCC 10023 TaxID=1680591 RepID=UPI0039C655D5